MSVGYTAETWNRVETVFLTKYPMGIDISFFLQELLEGTGNGLCRAVADEEYCIQFWGNTFRQEAILRRAIQKICQCQYSFIFPLPEYLDHFVALVMVVH